MISVRSPLKEFILKTMLYFNNNFYWWLIIFILLLLINVIIKIYKYYRTCNVNNLSIERFTNINRVNTITFFKFGSITNSTFISYKDTICKLLNTVLYIIYNDSDFINNYSNKKLILTIFVVNPINKLNYVLAQPVTFKFNNQISIDELINKIKWTQFNYNLKTCDVVIVIKIS